MQKIKNKIPVRHACADPDNSDGGGEGRIASRGKFVPVFIQGNKWQLMILMGRSGPPAPSVSAHMRVSNSLNSHFIFLLGLGGSRPDGQKTGWTMFFFSHQLILQFTEWIQWFYYRGEEGVQLLPGGGGVQRNRYNL